MIYTARFGEQTKGIPIDITVKGNSNHCLAPTWKMVMGYKRGDLSWEEYTAQYNTLLKERMLIREKEFYAIAFQGLEGDITLLCYCNAVNRCHRYLAKKFLESLEGVF